jgi:Protein of unknown function (DUF1428)
VKLGLPFPRGIKIKPGETVMFSWITYKSRAHRDRVNAKAMKDPRFAKMPKNNAIRCEAHALWRVQDHRRSLSSVLIWRSKLFPTLEQYKNDVIHYR